MNLVEQKYQRMEMVQECEVPVFVVEQQQHKRMMLDLEAGMSVDRWRRVEAETGQGPGRSRLLEGDGCQVV